jgi:hypothetical protein
VSGASDGLSHNPSSPKELIPASADTRRVGKPNNKTFTFSLSSSLTQEEDVTVQGAVLDRLVDPRKMLYENHANGIGMDHVPHVGRVMEVHVCFRHPFSE